MVLNKLRKDTISYFNENTTSTLKVLKTDVSKVKGTKSVNCAPGMISPRIFKSFKVDVVEDDSARVMKSTLTRVRFVYYETIK